VQPALRHKNFQISISKHIWFFKAEYCIEHNCNNSNWKLKCMKYISGKCIIDSWYLIILTSQWKAASTLTGGSLALVSMYEIYKVKTQTHTHNHSIVSTVVHTPAVYYIHNKKVMSPLSRYNQKTLFTATNSSVSINHLQLRLLLLHIISVCCQATICFTASVRGWTQKLEWHSIELTPPPSRLPPKSNGFFHGQCATSHRIYRNLLCGFCLILLTNK